MKIQTVLAVTLLGLCAMAPAREAPPFTLLGNGRLTVGVNSHGGLLFCRWPSPSHFDLLPSFPWGPAGEAATAWAVLAPGAANQDPLHWLRGEGLEAAPQPLSAPEDMHLTVQLSASAAGPVQVEVFVHPDQDLLVYQLRQEAPAEYPMLWWQNFAPRSRLAPINPLTSSLPGIQDFAVFAAAENELVHFRPNHPGEAAWLRAREYAEIPDSASWQRLGEGVWIVARALGTEVQVSCGEVSGPRAWQRLHENQPSRAAVGQVEGAFLFAPAAMHTVLLGFGASLESARAAVTQGEDRGVAALFEETRAHWKAWLVGTPPPAGEDLGQWSRAMLTLAVSNSADSGASVTAPARLPLRGWVDPVRSVWPILAMQRGGMLREAERSLTWYLQPRADAPVPWHGTIPAAFYSNGFPALPTFLVDLQGPAWMLSTALHHMSLLDPEDATAFARAIAPSVAELGDGLAAWMHGGTGDLLPAFDRSALRDTVTQEGRLVVWMGLESARQLLLAAEVALPETWEQRQRALETQLRFQVLHRTSAWNIAPMLYLWLDRVLPQARGIWGPILEAEDLSREQLPVVLQQAAAQATPRIASDAVSAALHCLAASARVYGAL